MKVVYVGPAPAVEVNTPSGYVGATRGEPIDVPADFAKALLEQDVWEAHASHHTKPVPGDTEEQP